MIIPSDIQNQLGQAFLLTSSGNNEKINQGTAILMQLRQEVLYPKILLDYFTSQIDPSSALRAAIEFKLWFQKYKSFADFEYNVVVQSVEVVKSQIIPIYLQCSKQISHMVQDAIVSIAQRDFPHNWPNFMSQLILVLDISQYQIEIIQRVLKLFTKLFAKYEYSTRSDPLYIEIIHVCDTAHDILLSLAINLLNSIQLGLQQSAQLDNNMLLQLKALKTLIQVFYFLNFQDLHPKFEDNLQNWMRVMQGVLQLQGRQAFKCKGVALRAVLLYATKYREDFEGLIQIFSQEIWNVCTQANEDEAYDKIVHHALKYFKSLVSWSEMRGFFESSMEQLVSHLITRNLAITKNDQINFTDEPIMFIETFFENSDLESRRAQTVELYKSLCKNYRELTSSILQSYVQQFVSVFNNIDLNNEILIINLIIDGIVTAYTSKDGAIDIQLDQSIPLYYYQQVLKQRLSNIYQLSQQSQNIDSSIPPIVLAFYCRFLFVYRNYIPQNEIISIIQVISKLLIISNHTTLHKIAAYTVEGLITIHTGDFKSYANRIPLFTYENSADAFQTTLQDLFNYLNLQSQLQPYAIRCLNVTLTLVRQNALPAVDIIGQLFDKMMKQLYDAYEFQNSLLVFESLGIVLYTAINQNNQQAGINLGTKLLSQLDRMLRDNKGDICTFILQIYSLLIRLIPSNNKQFNDYFEGIFRSFLVLDNWNETNQGLFPAYIILIEGWLRNRQGTKDDLIQLQNILGIIIQFSAQNFTLLSDTLLGLQQGQIWISNILAQVFKQYQVNLDLLNQQQIYSKSKMGSISQRMINKEAFLTLSNICHKFGVQLLIDECMKLQSGLLESFLINEIVIVRSIQNHMERRSIFNMITQLLFDGQMKLSQQCWQILFQSIIENFTLKRKAALRFQLREGLNQQITSSSGFQRLNAIQQLKVFIQFIQINKEKTQPLMDEEKYFGSKFKQFYSDPIIQQQLNISQLINTQQQEMLTQIIQNA